MFNVQPLRDTSVNRVYCLQGGDVNMLDQGSKPGLLGPKGGGKGAGARSGGQKPGSGGRITKQAIGDEDAQDFPPDDEDMDTLSVSFPLCGLHISP